MEKGNNKGNSTRNELENRTVEKFTETNNSSFFDKTTEIDEPLARMRNKKREDTNCQYCQF